MHITKILLASLLLLTILGCEPESKQVARVAQQSAARQAEQNQELAKLNREVAAGAQRLVEADSRTRQEIIAAQKDLAQQQAEVGKQRDQLEAERRTAARERYRESLLAPVISSLGLLLLCSLPLWLAWYLLRAWHRKAQDETVLGQLLIEELVSSRPILLPQPVLPPAIGHADARERLPGPPAPPTDSDDEPA